ncbi:hypothetical protein FACS1894187_21180 [Synergistales bacterium]|nr:hypothetical protein FACS1894187_21180 [Synergistales bacterium]
MKKLSVLAVLVFVLLAVARGSAWADIKPGLTTKTRDIVLVEEDEEEDEEEAKSANKSEAAGGDALVGVLNVTELHKNDFVTTLVADKEDGVYNVNDKIVLTFKSEEDAYLTILNFTAGGQTLVLFPNKWVKDNKVQAGQEIKIPAAGQKFSMRAGGPAGVDVIKAIATTKDTPVVNPENFELVGPFAILKDIKAATRDILLVEDEDEGNAGAAGAAPDKWSVASLAVMTRDPAKPDEPTGFGVANSGDWKVQFWTNGKNFLTGERVFMHFLSNKPAKLIALANLGASTNENFLLPDEGDIDVAADEILVLPRNEDKWKLVAASKPGKDVVMATLEIEGGTQLEVSLEVTVEE